MSACGKYVYEKHYRNCIKASGRTYPIAYCPVCHAVVPPTSVERSRSGAHGTNIYVHEHELRFVELWSSNSGKREVRVEPGFPSHLAERARALWLHEQVEPQVVEEELAALAAAEAAHP
jgi:hypothetical protein